MKTAMKFILPPIVVALGVLVLITFVKTKPQAAKAASEAKAPLVEVTVAKGTTQAALITGQGTVEAARQIVMIPQVSGKIIDLNPQFVEGGRLSKGDTALKIDARDYRLRVQQSAAQVQQAQFNLTVESGRRQVAEREWNLLEADIPTNAAGKNLALRKPQQANARAGLAAARSGLALARLGLDRTRVDIPFNALILRENIDIGQVVGPQTQLATLVGTDAFWVEVKLSVSDLGWVRFPGPKSEGSKVIIVQQAGEATVRREGQVLRLLPDVDPAGRMARIVVEVKDPLALEEGQDGLPLLLGAFVQAEISGRSLEQVVSIPTGALREDNTVWVLTGGVLDVRKVDVAWKQRGEVFVSKNLKDGEQVVVGRIDAPVQGMPLRTESAQQPVEASK